MKYFLSFPGMFPFFFWVSVILVWVLFLLVSNIHIPEFQMVQNGFWVFVDMASGKYLWRNFKELKNDKKMKNS